MVAAERPEGANRPAIPPHAPCSVGLLVAEPSKGAPGRHLMGAMMDAKTREVLEFDLVIDRICGWAGSSLGRDYLRTLAPAGDAEEAGRRAAPLHDMIALLGAGGSLPITGLFDPSGLLGQAKMEGAALEEEHWPPIGRLLRVIADLVRFREHHREDYPALARMLQDLEAPDDLLREIERAFDADGKLRDDASPELRTVRRQLKGAEQRLLRTIARITSDLNQRGLLQDNFSTLRAGRHVVPVKAGSRGRVQGIIHGGSASGETYYVEPLEVVEATNDVEMLREEERRQVFLFLRHLTSLLRPWIGMMEAMVGILRRVDGLHALARLSLAKGWNLPLVERTGTLRLFNAHHPLLQLSPETKSVPITFLLEREDRCIVLSGPNAGGKTTTMKTIGLLAALALCGCPIPAAPGSTLPAFTAVLADIGDQQDIGQGISTFSGHMRRIRSIWEGAGAGALVLLDELGTGTDPREGGALALALLEGFTGRARLTVTTSHLDPVKIWAEETGGVRNASFSLDATTREPTFRLRLDVPGASEALEIARKERLPGAVLDRARTIVGERHLQMGELLRRIEEKERRLAEAARESEARAAALQEQEELVRARANVLRQERLEWKESALREQQRAVSQVREQIESLIADLPGEEELQRRKELLLAAREEAIEAGDATSREHRRLRERDAQPAASAHKAGDRVFVRAIGQWGEILEMDAARERCRILVGRMEVWARLSDLGDHDPGERRREDEYRAREIERTIKGKKQKKRHRRIDDALRASEEQARTGGGSSNRGRKKGEGRPGSSTPPPEKPAGAVMTGSVSRLGSMELDLHGYRVDEALPELDRFLDRALLSDYPWVRICHGTGTGRLYRAVHDFLRHHPAVRKFRFGTPEEGGGGMTIVEL